ncbi:MAG: ABC transporter substrate-binding protein [Burkholderiales bacterium]|jgi:branched-chain amino acid transport system substrate-binding protein|uniref:ABC transporter substrate-binding protein n=1 Tax=Polynucleobacter sp. UK-FUSCHL-C3 TaxID=2955208 RepID=A0AAU8A140_9BURK|nr:ABC transporter substrate-binding protein [Burkholderiales bacterium]NBP47185.1 ABC transporter substrate-binding protein [Burkholderiaceae bacterium]NBP93068.1 ABC transporter substrate-binding protein [Burkholderiaceae bacterium]NBQ29509.1 ABC transporter substrate-binding protein [Burkholderiaceae bacterium]NBV80675.1 ABC transporter substrate-binding protein [Burkholderiaceae bacterium]
MKKTAIATLVASCFMAAAIPAQAQTVSDNEVRIGVLTDLSGIYSAIEGPGALLAAQMAAKDFGGQVLGKKIVITSADTQSKADLASSKAREMFEKDKVDMIVGNVSTASALAAMEVAEQFKRVSIVNGAASLQITNEKCTPYSIHYVYDTYALSRGTGKAVVDSGKKTWFFVTADYAFGHTLERDTTEVVLASGGKVLGGVKHPINTTDFSSFMAQAQSSKAEVIGLANAGGDTIGSVKQAAELGIMGSKQTVVPLLMFTSDIQALGLRQTAGMTFTEGWYWDFNDANRKFAERFMKEFKGKAPTSVQAGVYSATMQYLKAVEATKTDNSDAVMKQMKSIEINDGLFKGRIRADGKFEHDMYLLEVKKPNESKGPNDVAKVVKVIAAKDATLPLAQSKCKYVTK